MTTLAAEGYVHVPRALAAVDVRDATAILDACVATDAYAVRDILDLAPELRRLLRCPPIRALVADVLGEDAFVVRSLLFDKPAGANWYMPWHQDQTVALERRHDVEGFPSWTTKGGVVHARAPAFVLERILTVRIHLDDCTSESGPLRVVPGSHARGPLGAPEIARLVDEEDALECCVDAGDVIAMRPLLVHSSPVARAHGRRRVLHLELAAFELPAPLRWHRMVALDA